MASLKNESNQFKAHIITSYPYNIQYILFAYRRDILRSQPRSMWKKAVSATQAYQERGVAHANLGQRMQADLREIWAMLFIVFSMIYIYNYIYIYHVYISIICYNIR